MRTQFRRCESDEDFAAASLFLLENRQDLHPSFTTMDTVSLLYAYITEGYLHIGVDEDGQVVGTAAYYHGTQDKQFSDKQLACIDMVVLARKRRGGRLFLNSLRYMVGAIMTTHSEVEDLHFAALQENTYLCKLYAKFSKQVGIREGRNGHELIFSDNIRDIASRLNLNHDV